MYDKPDLVDEYISKGGHDDRADLRVAAFQWMNKHLKNDTAPVKYEAYKQLPGKELRVFPEGMDVPKDAINGKIDETFVKRAEVKLPEKEKFAEWKKAMMKELREKSFRAFPTRIPVAKVKHTDIESGVTMLYETEIHIEPILLSISPGKERREEKAPPFFVLNPKEEVRESALNWAKPFLGNSWKYYFHPRGVEGDSSWTTKSPPNYVERSYTLLGRTVDDGRLWDILATLRSLDDPPKGNWRVVGRGQAGILAAYAALFEPSIKEVVIIDPPTSHKNGPIFLNVLRVLDIPEALGLLAPDVSLTLIGAKDKAFDRTEQLYKLAGAEKKFRRK